MFLVIGKREGSSRAAVPYTIDSCSFAVCGSGKFEDGILLRAGNHSYILSLFWARLMCNLCFFLSPPPLSHLHPSSLHSFLLCLIFF
mmetsp:Transcript_10640/g.27849  ORF Transcript_10640/g.27849 Transcript_10640/m.27849 type:complete len:87 (+) Transcript_10640:800-1060(+)